MLAKCRTTCFDSHQQRGVSIAVLGKTRPSSFLFFLGAGRWIVGNPSNAGSKFLRTTRLQTTTFSREVEFGSKFSHQELDHRSQVFWSLFPCFRSGNVGHLPPPNSPFPSRVLVLTPWTHSRIQTPAEFGLFDASLGGPSQSCRSSRCGHG